ncbi:MAG: hypothetical protein H0Z39_11745 [Peptococcaceae bacterium]|nr:hypothetical protein [Peptococcaceae bacterium]
MTGLLFHLQWQQFRNFWWRRGLKKKATFVVVVLASLGFIGSLMVIGFGLGKTMPMGRLHEIASLGYLAAALMALLWSIPQNFNQLFAARDVEMLFAFPIPTHSIFMVKYIKSMVNVAGVLTLIFFPLLSFGAAAGAALLYYPVLVLLTGAVVIFITAVSHLFNLVLVQIIPPSRAKELMTVMTAMVGLLAALLGQLPNLMKQQGAGKELLVHIEVPAWLPTSWASTALTSAAQGDLASLLPPLLLAAGGGTLLFLSAALVERGFRLGWIRLSEGSHRKTVKAVHQRVIRPQHPVVAIGIKELRTLQRDMREWISMVPLLVFFGIFLFHFLGKRQALLDDTLFSWLVVQAVLLMMFSLASGLFTASSIARDGLATWIIRASPIGGWQIALGKFWVHWLVVFAGILFFNTVTGLFFGWPWVWFVLGTVVLGLLSLGVNGLGLWLGTLGAKYDPENPQQRLKTGTGLVLLILSLLYMLLAVVPFAFLLLPPGLQPQLAALAAETDGFVAAALRFAAFVLGVKVLQYGAGVLGLIILAVGTAVLTLYLSARRLDSGIQVSIVQGK